MSGQTFLRSLSSSLNRRARAQSLAPTEALESRDLLTVADFNGIMVGTFTGSASTFMGTTINIPDPTLFPDNQILSTVKNGIISNKVPGSGTGSITPVNNSSANVSFGSIASVFGFDLPITYSGTFTLGTNGALNGSGTWSIDTNGFGISGGGTWNTHRMNDTFGVKSGTTFRLDANNSRSWNTGDVSFKLGNAADIPVAGVWDPTLGPFDSVGVFRNGTWYLEQGDRAWNAGDVAFGFGLAGDTPLVGDWNGDGTDDVGVFRNGQFYLDKNGNHKWDNGPGVDTFINKTFGNANDIPVAGDWNGDGKDEIGVFRNGTFYLDYNGDGIYNKAGGDIYAPFGAASGDKPIVGDWNGDGKDEIGIVRNGQWYLDMNNDGHWTGTTAGNDALYSFGSASDTPLVGRWRPSDIPLLTSPAFSAPLAETVTAPPAATVTASQLAVPATAKANSTIIDDVFAGL